MLPPITPEVPEPSAVVALFEDFKRAIDAKDKATVYQIGTEWLKLEAALEAQVTALALEIAEAGEAVTLQTLYRHQRYQTLLAQMREQVDTFTDLTGGYIQANQKQLGALGVQHASQAIKVSFLQTGTAGAFFDVVPTEAVNLMVGLTGEGAPLGSLLREVYPQAVAQMTQNLITSVALGRPPSETARYMMDGMAGGGLNHALTVARTEQLRVYRESSRMQYEKSGLVRGYKRFASKSGNTCAVCLALDGEVYETSDLMSVNPNDRCVMIPLVQGVPDPEWKTGSEWFSEQAPDIQKQILGPGKYQLYREGKMDLKDVVKKSVDPTWGPTLSEVPLRDLLDLGPGSPGSPPSLPPLQPGEEDYALFIANRSSGQGLPTYLEQVDDTFRIPEGMTLGEWADEAALQVSVNRTIRDSQGILDFSQREELERFFRESSVRRPYKVVMENASPDIDFTRMAEWGIKSEFEMRPAGLRVAAWWEAPKSITGSWTIHIVDGVTDSPSLSFWHELSHTLPDNVIEKVVGPRTGLSGDWRDRFAELMFRRFNGTR